MKKIFTLISATIMATALHAQIITFGEVAQSNADLPSEWTKDGVKLALTNDGKPSVDLNTASFGTADSHTTYTSRLKTGGKSSSNRFLTLTVPSEGTVKIAARTGNNSDNTRTIVLTQGGTELLSYTFDEANAILLEDANSTKVYPYAVANVKAGDIVITFPVNGINIYAIEFVDKANNIKSLDVSTASEAAFNLSGQRVDASYKGVVIKNGKKAIQK